MDSKELDFFIISDSVGDTARKVLQAVLAQFPAVSVHMHHYPFIRTIEDLNPHLAESEGPERFGHPYFGR